jgi:hypothetical protein
LADGQTFRVEGHQLSHIHRKNAPRLELDKPCWPIALQLDENKEKR